MDRNYCLYYFAYCFYEQNCKKIVVKLDREAELNAHSHLFSYIIFITAVALKRQSNNWEPPKYPAIRLNSKLIYLI